LSVEDLLPRIRYTFTRRASAVCIQRLKLHQQTKSNHSLYSCYRKRTPTTKQLFHLYMVSACTFYRRVDLRVTSPSTHSRNLNGRKNNRILLSFRIIRYTSCTRCTYEL